jgi:hypothetical protein
MGNGKRLVGKMSTIYLLNMVGTDLYKIGHTKREISKRINEIQTGNPKKIEVIRLFETDFYLKVEGWMHNVHKQKRMEGEWFELTNEDVINFTNDCQKGHDIFQMLTESDNPFIY